MIDFADQIVFVTGAGRGLGRLYAMEVGQGWLAEPGSKPSADDVAAHFDQVSATEPFSVPTSIFDEVAGLCARVGIAS